MWVCLSACVGARAGFTPGGGPLSRETLGEFGHSIPLGLSETCVHPVGTRLCCGAVCIDAT